MLYRDQLHHHSPLSIVSFVKRFKFWEKAEVHNTPIPLVSQYHNKKYSPQSRQAGVFFIFCAIIWIFNRMAWQWAETLVEIRGILADIRGTPK